MEERKERLIDQIETQTIESAEISSLESGPLASKIEKSKGRNKSFVLDLRIHSPASLGYLGIDGIDTAPALVRLAKVKGLDVIAVTDYYSGTYIDRIRRAALESPITVIPGVVIRCKLSTCDDVVLSCLFPETYGTAQIEDFLRALDIPKEAFGNRKYIVKTALTQILDVVESRGGVVLPSRMDKTPHRMSALPELVEKYGFRTFDLAFRDSTLWFKKRWPRVKFNLFSFSNANALAQVGSRIAKVKMQDAGFGSVRQMICRVPGETVVSAAVK